MKNCIKNLTATITPFVDMQKAKSGNGKAILKEDPARLEGILAETGHPDAAAAKERLALEIEGHRGLSIGQKEQALYFLLSPTYPKDGYAIAQNYVRSCLRYARWRSGVGMRKI